MHNFKFLTTFLWVTTEHSINRFGPKKTGFFRSGCRLPVNLKSRQLPGCGCAENLAEKPDRTGLLNTSEALQLGALDPFSARSMTSFLHLESVHCVLSGGYEITSRCKCHKSLRTPSFELVERHLGLAGWCNVNT